MKRVDFQELKPTAPNYFFTPKDTKGESEYNKGFSFKELFRINGNGIVTGDDGFLINADKDQLLNTFERFQASDRNIESLCSQFDVKKKKGESILKGYDNIENEKNLNKYIQPIAYRPFDNRFIFYENNLVERNRGTIMSHFIEGENVGLVFQRGGIEEKSAPAFVTKHISYLRSWSRPGMSSADTIAPLYLYSNAVNKI